MLRHFCPWKEHLYDLEAEQGIEGQILYVLYEVRGWRGGGVGVVWRN